ncbi:MAG: hypothetical protein MUF04_11240 [Akkermansiaceae bacterium]|nr:hypothetical protein [Akkermansiaceae bacterium]
MKRMRDWNAACHACILAERRLMRMRNSSARDSWVDGVLMTNWICWFFTVPIHFFLPVSEPRFSSSCVPTVK